MEGNLSSSEGTSLRMPGPHKRDEIQQWSGWWFQPIWKIWVKMGSSSPNRGENKKYLKPPPSDP